MNFYFLLFYVLLILSIHLDSSHAFRWVAFAIYALLLISIIGNSLRHLFRNFSKRLFDSFDLKTLLLLALASVTLHIFMANQYPFVHQGDEIRDAGYDGMNIARSLNRDLFGWGHYTAQSNIIGILSSFTYHLFGGSIWTYRSLDILVATLDICFMYILLRYIQKNKLVAILGALTLTVIPHHMFFARTELVNIFDSFWAIILLLCYFINDRKKSPFSYVLLGVVVGFSATFHTPSRIFGALIVAFVVIRDFYTFYKIDTWKQGRVFGIQLIHLIAYIIIGYGPLILQTTPAIFMQSTHPSTSVNTASTLDYCLPVLQAKYIQSVQVLFVKPVTSRMPGKPLIPFPLGIAFLAGLVYIIVKERKKTFIVLPLMVILPFTNSAVTDTVGADHRLMTLVPVCVVCIAYGYRALITISPNSYVKNLFIALILLCLGSICFNFFASRSANTVRTPSQFLLEHAIRTISGEPRLKHSPQLCFITSERLINELGLDNNNELLRYLFPHTDIVAIKDETMPGNEIRIGTTCDQSTAPAVRQLTVACTNAFSWECPSSYRGTFIVRYSR